MMRQLVFKFGHIRRQWITLIGAGYLAMLAIAVAGAEETGSLQELVVELAIAQTDLQEFDPLLVKVTVKNPDDEPVISRFEFSFEASTTVIEVRRRGEAVFRRVGSLYGGLTWGVRGEPRVQIRAGRSVVAFGLLIDSTEGRLFSVPGDYELRARVADQKEYGGTSAPVTVSVRTVGAENRGAIEHANRILSSALTFGGIKNGLRPKDIAEATAAIPESELRQSLDWIRQIAAVRDASSADALNANLTALRNERKKFSPITREWVTRVLAQQLIALGQWKQAEEEIDLLSDNSEAKSELAYKLSERRKNASRADGQGSLD